MRSTIVMGPALILAALLIAVNALPWGAAAVGFGATAAVVAAVGERSCASPGTVFLAVWLVSVVAALTAIAGGSYEQQACRAAQHGGESDLCGLAMAAGLGIGALTAGLLGPVSGWLAFLAVRRRRESDSS